MNFARIKLTIFGQVVRKLVVPRTVPASLELERYLVHLIAARGLVMLEKALPQAMNQGGDHTHAHR